MALVDHFSTLERLRSRGVAGADDALQQFGTIVRRGEVIRIAVRDHAAGKAKLIAVPFHEVITTVQVIAYFIRTYFPTLAYPPELFADLRAFERSLLDLAALRRSFATQAALTAGKTNAFVPGPAPLLPYRLRQGDTLDRIALRTLGTYERAHEIVELNNLVYPYLDTDRDLTHPSYAIGDFLVEDFETQGGEPDRTGVADGVKVPGDVIYLPSDARIMTPEPVHDLDLELWGRDIQVVDGYPVLSTDTGEFQTIQGQNNIVQAVTQRVGSMKGDLPLHPNYGMDQLLAVGIEGTRSNIIASGLETARTVKQDPRVTHVRNIRVLFADTVNTADMSVGLIGSASREIPLNLVVPESLIGG